MQKKLFGGAIIACLLCFALYCSLFFYLKVRLPQHEGEMSFKGLSAPVTIKRDRYGIPHISAKNEKDLYMAYGYSVASDRLFQMDIGRRLGSGRLSEIFGPATLNMDKFFRTLRFCETLSDNWQRHQKDIPPHMLEIIESFLQGVNSFIAQGHLPLEFLLLGYTPAPFSLEDIFAFVGHMSFSFAYTFEANLLFDDLAKKLAPAKLNEMRQHLRNIPSYIPVPNLSDVHLLPHQFQDIQRERVIYDTLHSMIASFGPLKGSNSWVLSGKRTQSGKPLLANDPHISFSNPNIWYEAHLNSPGYEIYGHFLPLVPFPLLGHNRDHAWALTMSLTDEMIFFKEKFNPHNPKLIQNGEEWFPLHYYESTIKVKDEEDVTFPIRLTPRGPLLTEVMADRKGSPLSLYWTFYHPDNVPLLGFYQLSRSNSLESFSKYFPWIKSPGLNMSYIDQAGHIAWWVLGAVVVRPPGLFGDMILDVERGEHLLLKQIPFSDNPHLIDPPSGVIVSANFRPFVPLSYRLEGTWASSERYERITSLLQTKEKWSLEELKSVQTDHVDLLAQKILPTMLTLAKPEQLKNSPYTTAVSSSLIKEALLVLRSWKGDASIDSIGMTLFAQWIDNLVQVLLEKEIAPGYKAYCKMPDSLYFIRYIFEHEDSQWRKNGQLERALDESFMLALFELSKKLGPDLSSWRWGKVHTVEYIHPIGRKWPFNYLFNQGPFEAMGGHHQINCMEHNMCSGNFQVVAGPTTRKLVDMGDPLHSYGILPLGNSGNLADPHHHDQAGMFLKGLYRYQLLDENEIEEEKTKELLLNPL